MYIKAEITKVSSELALLVLDRAAAAGERARLAMDRLQTRYQTANKTRVGYDLLSDSETLAMVKSALEAGAEHYATLTVANSAARALRYLNDPTADEWTSVPIPWSDFPSVDGVLSELIQIGEASDAASKRIRTEMNVAGR